MLIVSRFFNRINYNKDNPERIAELLRCKRRQVGKRYLDHCIAVSNPCHGNLIINYSTGDSSCSYLQLNKYIKKQSWMKYVQEHDAKSFFYLVVYKILENLSINFVFRFKSIVIEYL